MAITGHSVTILAKTGDIVPNAPIEVRLYSTGLLANIYEQDGTPITQLGATADENGIFRFWAEPDEYFARHGDIDIPITVAVDSISYSSLFGKFNPPSLIDAINDDRLVEGDALNIKERELGNGGGAMWDVVLVSTVTPNGFNVVQCTGVTTLALVLRLTNVLHARQFGLTGVNDTAAATALFNACQDGNVIDFDGMNVNIVHDGVNSNPYPTDTGDPNQTTYMLLSNKNGVTLRNGTLSCNLDMTSNSLIMLGFIACKRATLDNIEINMSCSGVPSYAVNGHETFAALISCRSDGTDGCEDFTIKSNCKFRINHPSGASIGTADGNPVHNYSGKLVGVNYFGDYAPLIGDAVLMTGLTIEDGVEFFECTARNIWLWMCRETTIGDINFLDCGTVAGPAHSMIRMLHHNVNTKIGKIYCDNCIVADTTGHWILSNNNGPYHPTSVTMESWIMKDCAGGNAWSIADGVNCEIGDMTSRDGSFTNHVVTIFNGGGSSYQAFRVGKITANEDGKILNVSCAQANEVTINGIEGFDGSTSDNAVDLNYSNGPLRLRNIDLAGYEHSIFAAQNCDALDIEVFSLRDANQSGLSFNTPAMDGSELRNGEALNNGNLGVRIPPNSKAINVDAKGNVGDGLLVGESSIVEGGEIDDGPATALTASGIRNETGISGQVAKNVILKSTNARFAYGIDYNTTATIVHNTFLGAVGTTSKWRTFGGSTVVGNTPNDTP